MPPDPTHVPPHNSVPYTRQGEHSVHAFNLAQGRRQRWGVSVDFWGQPGLHSESRKLWNPVGGVGAARQRDWVVHTYNLIMLETKTGGLPWAWDQPVLYSESQVNLGFSARALTEKNKNKNFPMDPDFPVKLWNMKGNKMISMHTWETWTLNRWYPSPAI